MIYTKEEFKRLWYSDEHGGGITNEDCADCAKAWGLFANPRCCSINAVIDAVCEAAGCIEDCMYDNLFWRILTEDGKVIKDDFNTKEEASEYARKHTTLRSWLIQGYEYSCVIEFNERDFNAADNL
jgi:hypothetical protein